jgi:hypothetical protein
MREAAARYYYETVVLLYQGDDCLLWPFARRQGYGYIATKDRKQSDVHRLACIAVHGEPPTPKHEAAHSCGRGREGCVNPRHLRWATKSENQIDSVRHGTSNAKLTEAQVRKIRLLCGKVSQRRLAMQFGVSQMLISLIQTRKRWSWVK